MLLKELIGCAEPPAKYIGYTNSESNFLQKHSSAGPVEGDRKEDFKRSSCCQLSTLAR